MSTFTGHLAPDYSRDVMVERNGVDSGVLVYSPPSFDGFGGSERGVVADDIAADVALAILEQAKLGENEHFARAIVELTDGLAEEKLNAARAKEEEEVRRWRFAIWGTPHSGPVLENERETYRKNAYYFKQED